MKKISIAAAALVCACATTSPRTVALDHILISVARDAPERAVLEQAGFKIARGVNKHTGQGTASVTIEFQNAFLELVWPDPTVPLEPAFKAGAEKFRNRSEWRTSGWCPFGFALHRAGSGPIPVPTWSIAAPWMEPGTEMVMLTPRADTRSPSISIHPHAVSEDPAKDTTRSDLRAAGAMDQPNGVRRVTAVRLIMPPDYAPTPGVQFAESQGVFSSSRGDAWAVELTFDGARRGTVRDFRPNLPLIVKE